MVIYIQGSPTPNPRISPTATARPIVSPNTSVSKVPLRTASSMMKAIIVASMSVSADSKLRTDFASLDMLMFLTNPKTMAELLPPTMDPNRALSSRPQPNR